jgi:glycosyltransferase involved in cell wall biosynthesis
MTYGYIAEQPATVLEDDVYVFSRLQDENIFYKVKEAGKKVVIDIDDYWNLHPTHPLRYTEANAKYVATITKLLPLADLVTCTTANLWEKIYDEFGVTATIIKNTIPDGLTQFSEGSFEHEKVRFGYVGGVYHLNDMELMREGIARTYEDRQLINKFQFCLAGFNPNREFIAYEKLMTNDYKKIDTDYKSYLDQLTPALSHIALNKPYRRLWARSVDTYGKVYRDLDVCLIPLEGKQSNGNVNVFNSCKSELKLLEAGMTNKAVICSDVMPYHPFLNHEENCLAINQKKNDWYRSIRILALDKDMRIELADNLTKQIKKDFSHKTEVNKLATALKKLK